MVILAIHVGHDASVCVLNAGEIVYYCENERLNHQKHTSAFSDVALVAMKKYIPDYIFLTFLNRNNAKEIISYVGYLVNDLSSRYWGGKKPKFYSTDEHHWFHASNAFYSSGFDEATVIVMDGGGKIIGNNFLECESVFKYSYHANQLIFREDNHIAKLWEDISIHFFGSGEDSKKEWYHAGKLMGASTYGKENPKHVRAYLNNKKNNDFTDYVKEEKISFEDASYRLQIDSFAPLCSIVDRAIEMTNPSNICLSGGFFMNVVNNYKLLKHYPNINFWIDPICHDGGISIGTAKHFYHEISKSTEKFTLTTPYLGNQANYDRDLRDDEIEYKVTPQEVAQIISERNIVAIYQGRAEAGPRALGNRSLLYDPRDPNGRDIVNTIKKREYYRPFAGTVLAEHAHDWFEMLSLKESPFMSYAIPMKEDKRELVPALRHNDGTSRIQTVNRQQNENYYDLIQAFYNITGVPMVLNTSFNLAGDTMVDNMNDAIQTCRDGAIPYLYCPERELLIDFTGHKNGSKHSHTNPRFDDS